MDGLKKWKDEYERAGLVDKMVSFEPLFSVRSVCYVGLTANSLTSEDEVRKGEAEEDSGGVG